MSFNRTPQCTKYCKRYEYGGKIHDRHSHPGRKSHFRKGRGYNFRDKELDICREKDRTDYGAVRAAERDYLRELTKRTG